MFICVYPWRALALHVNKAVHPPPPHAPAATRHTATCTTMDQTRARQPARYLESVRRGVTIASHQCAEASPHSAACEAQHALTVPTLLLHVHARAQALSLSLRIKFSPAARTRALAPALARALRAQRLGKL